MKTDFEQWLAAQFADTGAFTIFIVLVRIGSDKVVPVKSSYAHLIGDDMPWPGMRGLLDSARTPWDGVAFFVGLGHEGGPLPDAVARSTGTDAVFAGSAFRSAATRAFTASSNAGFDGPRFDPDDAAALYAGLVADSRLQKYFGNIFTNLCATKELKKNGRIGKLTLRTETAVSVGFGDTKAILVSREKT